MTTETCQRPNCKGTIEDGYCDICGLAAVKSLSPNLTNQVTNQVTGRTAATAASAPMSSPLTNRSSKGTRRTSSTTVNRSTRKQLGAGLVAIPALPSTEPETLIMSAAIVPENKRFCASCNHQLRRERGFCSKCGQKYSFVPSLKPGDRVMDQYEVKGAIAYGGLGWIYLGFDTMLSRYVVLKGLLNTEDASSAAVALAERKFLAAVKHPNIVGVYNFVNHGGEGFIIMEYVGGQSLKDIRKARGPLPPAEAVAYIHRVLGAFGYLHNQGLVYCDFKPDNMMLEGDDIKLIDMGGVRRLDDPDGDIYGTVGYTAPEIAEDGPTVSSDLYTIARTLVVLLTNIPNFSKDNRYQLPKPHEEPLFARYESLYRWLLKSTAAQPGDRFGNAEEMADQLLGVLREMVAQDTQKPRPASSSIFGGDRLVMQAASDFEPIQPNANQLPHVMLDPSDPAFQNLLNIISIPNLSQRARLLIQLAQQFPQSLEVRLQWVNTLMQVEEISQIADLLTTIRSGAGSDLQVSRYNNKVDYLVQLLDRVKQNSGWDWRLDWYLGKAYLIAGDGAKAKAAFNEVYSELPGELAPKLALGLAAEMANQHEVAQKFYRSVSGTDPNYPSATFGLARSLGASGQRQAAVQVIDQVPAASSLHLRSRVEKARLLVNQSTKVNPPTAQDLQQAGLVIEATTLAGMEKQRLSCELFQTALTLLRNQVIQPDAGLQLMGQSLQEVKLRTGLEKALRAMAHLAIGEEKIRLVDEANRVRPRTWT
jgi:serine/threonine-protein kinase PknG